MSVLMIPFVWLILTPLYGDAFSTSRMLFLILLPGSVFWGVFTLISSDLEGRGQPWKVSSVSLQSAVAILVLDTLLIPRLGAQGAAIASSITRCLSLVLLINIYTRMVKINPQALIIPGKEDLQFLVNIVSTLFFRFKKAIFVEEP
jgi:O-antigen/teichoic acid export membrane protein